MRRAALLISATAVLAGVSCGPAAEKPKDPDDLPLLGTKPFSLLPKPEFTFTDTHGNPYDFRKETDGKIALLYFGYTYCPDTCPLMMATLGAALKEVDPAVRDQVRMVFVTVDPGRDTPERLRSWLGSFDTTFVGLRGSMTVIDSLEGVYGFPPTKKESVGDGYVVSHPALVYAFTPDDKGRVMYGADTRKATWVHDLKLIAAHAWHAGAATAAESPAVPSPEPGEAAGGPAGIAPTTAASGSIQVLEAYAPAPPSGATTMAVYLTLLNTGATADTLVGLDSDVAAMASLHQTMHTDNMAHMKPVPFIALPPGDTVRLAPGGLHGMLMALKRHPAAGDTLMMVLTLARGGTLNVPTPVVRYEDLVR
ncbi:MAG: SCO family protein [Gemmatimonadetes bacterium]|nr:SCO family protein [Gemmatimonadota bacterium]